FSSRRRHTRWPRDWSSDVCSSDLQDPTGNQLPTPSQPASPPAPEVAHLDIYGFAMLDSGYNFGRIDPDWFDVVRPVTLPSSRDRSEERRVGKECRSGWRLDQCKKT